jgi:S1-C subfamily serine protease
MRGVLSRLMILVLALFAVTAPARADDVSAASRSIVRVAVGQVQADGSVAIIGHGTGFAVGPNRIVTNAHVVAMAIANPDTVRLGIVPSEGSPPSPARIILVDPARDLALLEMTEGRLPVLTLFSGRLDPGMAVAALGYPGNVDLATAQSAEDLLQPRPPSRSVGIFSDVRQGDLGATLVHTASIARGNSGGPLVDSCGRVIGVNRMITRNDMGDSTFGFAIPTAALIEFLQEAHQPFRAIATECVSVESRQRAESDRAEQERQQRASDEAVRTRAADERRNHALVAIEEARETRLYLSILLLVLALGSMGAAGILYVKDKPRPAIGAGVAALILLIASTVVFLTRPSLNVSDDDLAADTVAADPAVRFVGQNLCQLDRSRSRITVTTDDRVPLGWTADGCVNNATQYAQDGATWRRVLVPNEDQTVTLTEFSPGNGEYVVTRYLLSADAMNAARQLRRRVEQKACTADLDIRARMADQQRDLVRTLPRQFNERLVYRCAPAAPAAG